MFGTLLRLWTTQAGCETACNLLHRQEQSFYSALTDGGLLTLGLEERIPSDVEQVWQTFLASKAFGRSARACLPLCLRYLIGCQGCCMKKFSPYMENSVEAIWRA